MSASRKRSTPPNTASTGMINASMFVAQTVDEMTDQLKNLHVKKSRRFLNQPAPSTLKMDKTALAVCATSSLPPRAHTPVAGTPHNASPLLIKPQQLQTTIESRSERPAFTIDEVTYEIDHLSLTDRAASSSTPSNR